MSVRLSADDAWSVLTSAHTGILTSLRADGSPVTLPVWFVVIDRRIYVDTPATAKKVLRIKRDARVSLLVESGEHWAELRGVQLNGAAAVVEEPELLVAVGAALAQKYAGFTTPREEMPEDTRGRYQVARAVIGIEPHGRILSWDNARLS
jgi:PPOX class probable F420-dependent enzyme